jgi:hypothetical protein
MDDFDKKVDKMLDTLEEKYPKTIEEINEAIRIIRQNNYGDDILVISPKAVEELRCSCWFFPSHHCNTLPPSKNFFGRYMGMDLEVKDG